MAFQEVMHEENGLWAHNISKGNKTIKIETTSDYSCYFLAKNLTTFCLTPENLRLNSKGMNYVF